MKLQINISGMSCNHCVKRVQEALLESFKPKSLDVDLENQHAIMEVDQELDYQAIFDVLDDVGYDVTSINALD